MPRLKSAMAFPSVSRRSRQRSDHRVSARGRRRIISRLRKNPQIVMAYGGSMLIPTRRARASASVYRLSANAIARTHRIQSAIMITDTSLRCILASPDRQQSAIEEHLGNFDCFVRVAISLPAMPALQRSNFAPLLPLQERVTPVPPDPPLQFTDIPESQADEHYVSRTHYVWDAVCARRSVPTETAPAHDRDGRRKSTRLAREHRLASDFLHLETSRRP